ncbi:MAG: hypothetical protein JO272_09590 [Pseudonocardiales bacterium]|nr:hypothetical protein [Pseudonocardiales bacterium]
MREAVLLAAIACEMKVKDAIEMLARHDQKSLVELVLKNPRDVPIAAASLFDKALKAVCGKSMREDKKELFKSVEKLYQTRNSIAHRGGRDICGDSELGELIRSAVKAFAYLDELLLMHST